MPRNIRIVLVLIVSQAICLALGLWVQDQFIVASAKWTAENPSRADADGGRDGIAAVSGPLITDVSEIPTAMLLDSMLAGRMLGFVWICGLQSVVAYLTLTRTLTQHDKVELQSQEENLLKTKDLIRTRDAVIFGLAKLAESRDPDTGHHLERIALYSTRIASALRRDPRYRDVVTPTFVRTIGISSALHDIGKVGVEDSVLLKPGRLDRDERFRMQIHTTLGGECIEQIEQRLGNSNFLGMAREVAYCHHERWDGEGYPVGLQGEEIPLAARIVSIADVYDALASRRVYKEPYSHEKCMEIILAEAGRQFDPQLLEVFTSIEGQFRAISQRFAEPQADFIAPNELTADQTLSSADREPPSVAAAHPSMSSEQERLITETLETNTTAKAASA